MKKINDSFIGGSKEMSDDFNIKNIFEIVYDHHANCSHSGEEGEKKGKDKKSDEGSDSNTKKSDN